MSDANRLVRPGAVAQRSAVKTATRQYCQAAEMNYDAVSKCIHFSKAAGGPAREHPLSGASRVKGNFHARFLGGRGRVNRLRLPGLYERLAFRITAGLFRALVRRLLSANCSSPPTSRVLSRLSLHELHRGCSAIILAAAWRGYDLSSDGSIDLWIAGVSFGSAIFIWSP